MIIPRPADQLLLPANFHRGHLVLGRRWWTWCRWLAGSHARCAGRGAGLLGRASRRNGRAVGLPVWPAMDVHDGALLGQVALAYSLLSFGAISLHRRLPWVQLFEQALQVFAFVRSACRRAAVRLMGGEAHGWPGWWGLMAPVLERPCCGCLSRRAAAGPAAPCAGPRRAQTAVFPLNPDPCRVLKNVHQESWQSPAAAGRGGGLCCSALVGWRAASSGYGWCSTRTLPSGRVQPHRRRYPSLPNWGMDQRPHGIIVLASTSRPTCSKSISPRS